MSSSDDKDDFEILDASEAADVSEREAGRKPFSRRSCFFFRRRRRRHRCFKIYPHPSFFHPPIPHQNRKPGTSTTRSTVRSVDAASARRRKGGRRRGGRPGNTGISILVVGRGRGRLDHLRRRRCSSFLSNSSSSFLSDSSSSFLRSPRRAPPLPRLRPPRPRRALPVLPRRKVPRGPREAPRREGGLCGACCTGREGGGEGICRGSLALGARAGVRGRRPRSQGPPVPGPGGRRRGLAVQDCGREREAGEGAGRRRRRW